MQPFIKKFSEISITDVESVGGKNASLGEMFNKLSSKGIRVPDGFATTAFTFRTFLAYNNLIEPLEKLLAQLDKVDYSNLDDISNQARTMTNEAIMPPYIEKKLLKHITNYVR